MSAETVEERKHRLLQRIEDGGVLGIEAHEEVLGDTLDAISEYLEKQAEIHLNAHTAATTERMMEWHRGMWEAYNHAAGIVSRGEVPEELGAGEHQTEAP